MFSLADYLKHPPYKLEDTIQIFQYEQVVKELNGTKNYVHCPGKLVWDQQHMPFFTAQKNKCVLLYSGDIDFPPLRLPYSYNGKYPDCVVDVPYEEKQDFEVLKTIEDNNLHVFGHGITLQHPRMTCMPIGAFHKITQAHLNCKREERTILCYANFGISLEGWWFGPVRKVVHEHIRDKDFILKENTCWDKQRNVNNLDHFYKQIGQSKFAICPRGCGFDTYRLWDCLYLGCIPIVERYDIHKEWEDLPILFIDSIHDYETMTEEWLNQKYEEMLQKSYNYEKISKMYWMNKLRALGE